MSVSTRPLIKKTLAVPLAVIILAALLTGSVLKRHGEARGFILQSDNTSAVRNNYLIKDLEYLKMTFPAKHINPFVNMSHSEFDALIDSLIDSVPSMNNAQVFVGLNKILTAVGDAHTKVEYWDGFTYPLRFSYFDDKLYITNADKKYEKLLYSRVLAINGYDISYVLNELSKIIPHENEYWINARLTHYLFLPVFMYGLGIIPNESATSFTLEDRSGNEYTELVDILEYGQINDFCVSLSGERNVYKFYSEFEEYYWYEYLSDERAVYFKYNVCAQMQGRPFEKFARQMFDAVSNEDVERFIIDLRHNQGGNSSVIDPFTERFKDYLERRPGISVYIIIGNETFSSGLFAIRDILAITDAVLVGEPTGGSPNAYGEVKSFYLPFSQLRVHYCIKYFSLTQDKTAAAIEPDIHAAPNIEDYIANRDVVLEAVINDEGTKVH